MASETQLLTRLGNQEDSFVERKPEGANRRELRRELVAFANSVPHDREAVLFIGVDDNGVVKGVGNADKLQKTLREIAERDCYPPIRYAVDVLSTSDGAVVAVTIPPSKARPHFAGPAFVRVGSETNIASEDLFNELIASRNTKAGAILRYKGKMVTVIARKVLGSTKLQRDPMYRASHECRVESCDAHTVTLLDGSKLLSEPLEKVTIRHDLERERMMLEIVE
ncbi:MAG: ATP-binding protein [Armatimonadota bacterium]|nr:ATP-binding protein [Armatimonadota bacterium]